MSLNPKMRREIFEIVWTTVRDAHWDPALGGVNWIAARKKWEPRALSAKADAGFYEALEGLLGELKQSHFAVIPPFEDRPKSESGGGGVSGATLAWAENQVLVSAVRADSPAEKAGIKPGFVLLARNGKPLAPLVQKLVAAKARPVEIGLFLRSLAGGGVGQTLAWTVKDETDAVRDISVACASPKGEIVQQLGLPPVPVEFESKILDDGSWYFRFNIFLIDNQNAFRDALAENQKARSLVLDLRGNPGGLLPMTYGFANRLALWRGNLGTQQQRNNRLRFPVAPFEGEPVYRGPVAILTDELSLSCSEVLAGGLQEMGRAKTVGRRTGGMVLPASIKILPGGGRLEFAVADFKTPKGVLLEGRGVIPDIPVPLTRKLLLSGPDPDLAAAQKWIASKGR